MATWNLVLTDTGSRAVAFPKDFDQIKITRRMGDTTEATLDLNIYDQNVQYLDILSRAVKFYRNNVLVHYGAIWEPLEIGFPAGAKVMVKDPFEFYKWRRVRAAKTYTAADAGAIASDRVSIQNGFGTTHLAMGTIQTSVNRTVTYNPGKVESEIFQELAGMSSGFFFVILPVDGVPGTYAQMLIRYPTAGTTREEVRFGFGPNSIDNLSEYKVLKNLVLNRETVASSASTGGRITATREDTSSENTYGIMEDESSQSADVSDTNVLGAFADAQLHPTPPISYQLKPNINSPMLFQDFDVGDLVRLHIEDGPYTGGNKIWTWVRVLEASMTVNQSGTEILDNLVVETLQGYKPGIPPGDQFRDYIDNQRATLEALSRKVQTLTVGTTAPGGTGSGTGVGSDPGQTPPAGGPPPSPPPPPSPQVAPRILSISASAYWDTSTPQPVIVVSAVVDPGGLATTVGCTVGGTNAGSAGISGQGGQGVGFQIQKPKNAGYTVIVSALNAAGSDIQSTSVNTPAVQQN